MKADPINYKFKGGPLDGRCVALPFTQDEFRHAIPFTTGMDGRMDVARYERRSDGIFHFLGYERS